MNSNSDFIPVSKPYLTQEAKTFVVDCLDSGWISSKGAYVERFENEFAEKCGAKHAISVSSGTAALHLALLCLGIGSEDEVIVPDLTFAATANAVILCGATPVLCCVNKDEWTLDVNDAEAVLSDKTKAIIPVHLYGNPARMHEINDFAKRNGLTVIEDCAESLGATLDGHYLGTFGDMGCYSFFANKLLSTGEGGMVTTDSDALALKIRTLRDHGMSTEKRYWHDIAGLNYRMTNIQAAIGVSQLNVFDEFAKARSEQEALYKKYLLDVPGVIFKRVIKGAIPVNWLMSLRIDEALSGISAAELQGILTEHQIESRLFFYPLHQQPPYSNERAALKSTDVLSSSGLSLPTFVGLSCEDIQRVCEIISTAITNRQRSLSK
ncbi:DegT/DnrJ/EryC1/StrS family aminotransferase [Alteromonas stellipolaris]|uniref:DegT/DnrJ/EryC1/StrS family aminotransferase n=1 Tax=Alteromonas stellipolaris TaxID=233316 RepID=UPI0027347C5F|nr:DegT/DnrJ/EryC1/StrS family aminotransferase [Alteromonas stellipolaris]MDP2537418.1 DegT/DnrJ/EryC1/StrS family aminotransferase [Alteromonas stellipolaris]